MSPFKSMNHTAPQPAPQPVPVTKAGKVVSYLLMFAALAFVVAIIRAPDRAEPQGSPQTPVAASPASPAPAPVQAAPTATPAPAIAQPAPDRVRVLPGERFTMARGFFACRTVEDYDRVDSIAHTDRPAAEQRLAALMNRGACVVFDAGSAIMVEERTNRWTSESMACVRRQGRGDDCVWTGVTVIERNARRPI